MLSSFLQVIYYQNSTQHRPLRRYYIYTSIYSRRFSIFHLSISVTVNVPKLICARCCLLKRRKKLSARANIVPCSLTPFPVTSESIVSRRFDGLWAPRTADDSAAVYTISVRLPDSSAFSIDSLTLRLEACGLGPSDVMERDASVFIAADTQGSGRETESVDRPWRAWLALPMVGDVRSDGRRLAVGVEESWRPVTVLRETSGDSGVWKSNVAGAGGFGIRRLVENCSASCLQSDEQPCYNDPECEFGGLGCNALDDPLCRFCGFADFLDCNTGPTPVPVPTPPPTGSPAREPCDGWCLDSEDTPCFDDPTCQSGGIGCNAGGDFYCRFCGFELFVDCPIQPTPSPTMAPSPGVTLALTPSTTPTPTPVGVVPP